MDGYCWTCGWHAAELDDPRLDPVTAMCAWCTRAWQESAVARQPQGDITLRAAS